MAAAPGTSVSEELASEQVYLTCARAELARMRQQTRHGVDHGMLGASHGDVDHQVDVVPATVAKGLEFDRVIVVEPSAIAAAEPDRRTGLRRLYVVLTRAVSELTVFHSTGLPVELAPKDLTD